MRAFLAALSLCALIVMGVLLAHADGIGGGIGGANGIGNGVGDPSGIAFVKASGGGNTPSAIYNDGASAPIAPFSAASFYDPGTNTVWQAWEGYSSLLSERVEEVATYNLTSKTWAGNYIGNSNTLTNDYHGVPVMAADSSGRVYMACCSHSSTLRINQVGTLSDGPFAAPLVLPKFGSNITFPQLVSVGTNTLYLFYNTGGAGTNLQEAISVVIGTTSANGISWGTPKTLIDSATSGQNEWLPIDMAVANGTDIHLVFQYAAGSPGTNPTANMYAVYDTLTGNLRNYANTHTDNPAAQPVSLATLQANYQFYTGVALSPITLAIDSGGNSHIVFDDASNYPSLPNNYIYIEGTSGSFSAPFTFYNPNNAVGAFPFAIVTQPSTAIDVYVTDGSDPSSLNTAGNIVKVSRSSGGVWTSPVTIQSYASFGTLGLDLPVAVLGGGGTAYEVAWSQVSNDYITTSGALNGYAYSASASAFVQRPSGYIDIAPGGTATLDPANTVPQITLSASLGFANLTATATAGGSYVSRGTTSHSSGLLYLEATQNSGNTLTGDVALGLVTSAFPINGTVDLGANASSIGVYNNGAVFINNVQVGTVAGFSSQNTTIGIAVDFTHQKIWVQNGGGGWNNDTIANQNPSTNAGGISIASLSGALFPAVELSHAAYTNTLNFGEYSLVYGPPPNFAIWNYLLKRDLEPGSNDNAPASLSLAA